MPSRDYQLLAAQSVWDYFTGGSTGNPLILMPTGTGKSHVIAEFCQSVLRHYPHQRIQVLTHVKELIEQNYNKLLAAWPTAPAGIYSAGLNKRDIHNSIVFGGIASVGKKAHAFGHVDLILIDEAHLVSPSEETTYKKYIAALLQTNPYLKVVGLTATGFRLGHGRITEGDGALFSDVCFDMTGVEAFNWLISEGYLLPLVPRKPKVELNIDGVHMRGGEYIQSELVNAVDKKEITLKALREAAELGATRWSWLIFAAGVEHAVHIAEIALADLQIACGVVSSEGCYTVRDGALVKCNRDDVLADFKTGRLRALANNNILTTGFDHPPMDLILMLRPTASTGLWVQMLGRGTRPCYADGPYNLSTRDGRLAAIAASHKQNCLVLDYAGNTRRLGPINDPVIPGPKGKGGGEAPVKLCEVCDTYNHASVRLCTNCGNEFPIQTKLKQEASTAEIIKGELPVVETFKVDQITYQMYEKIGKPTMMKVSYYCGLRQFNEYVCLEHSNFAKKKAHDWWRERSNDPPPALVADALQDADRLRRPTHLRIWVNKQYPEIMKADYSGTAFSTQDEQMDNSWPDVSVSTTQSWRREYKATAAKSKYETNGLQDDDIPF